jgi:hypothetical protein
MPLKLFVTAALEGLLAKNLHILRMVLGFGWALEHVILFISGSPGGFSMMRRANAYK